MFPCPLPDFFYIFNYFMIFVLFSNCGHASVHVILSLFLLLHFLQMLLSTEAKNLDHCNLSKRVHASFCLNK